MRNHRKVFLLVCCCQFFFLGFEAAGLQQILQKIGASFGASQAMLGALIAMQYLAMMTMPVLCGRFSDRFGKRRTALLACVSFLIGSLCILFAGSVVMLGVGIFLCGAGYSICESTGIAAIYDIFQAQAARRISLSQALFSLGGIVSPILIQWLMDGRGSGWQVLFIILLAVNLFALPLVFLFYPSAVPKQKPFGGGTLRETAGFSTPAILLLCIAIFVASGLENGYCYYVDLYAMQALHASSLTAKALSAFWAANVIIRLLYSVLPSGHSLLLLCFGGAAAVLGGLASFPRAGAFVMMSALLGGLLAPMWPAIQSRAMAEFPEHTATISGLMSIPCGGGGVLLLSLAGKLADSCRVQAVYAMLAALALAGLSAYGGYSLQKRKQTRPHCGDN